METRAPPRLGTRIPQPHQLHRQITARVRRLQTPTTPSIVKSPFGLALAVRPAGAAEVSGVNGMPEACPACGTRSTVETGGADPDNAGRGGLVLAGPEATGLVEHCPRILC